MSATATQLPTRALPEAQRTLNPEAFARVKGSGREIAANKLEEYARMLRSGELDGVRVQWRDDSGEETAMVTVTIAHGTNGRGGIVQMLTTQIEEV